PRAAAGREALAQPFAAAERPWRIVARLALRPGVERRQDGVIEDGGPVRAPVLPREEAGPPREAGAAGRKGCGAVGHAREGEVADRDGVRAAIAVLGVTAAVAERVELLDIADREAGLLLDPAAQADLEGVVCQRIERTRRQADQRAAVAGGQRHR